ncbi:DUF5107 domain-containing protein [Chitinophaga sp. MM2321]|uniref:DUF5107 domain-containing protein n=1 Tax=Chitinophaga sp. MM2321 TaxID=3137178 RepID=UPI0032D589B5
MKEVSIVEIWEEEVIIPTYPVGKPEKNPLFLEKRVYQGSSGTVYPNPVIEKIYDEKIEQKYRAVFLENKYLKIMILPELGGRVQMAFDKVKQRHFVYYNQVIKPALVGLTGPWISGGIEFNWPQHHRPSTYEPVDFRLKKNEDGSCTVWVNEVERMFGTKGMAGFTLYPDKAYLEVKAQLYNRTPFPQTFLWWANPAVNVNDDYQSVFPPDVNAVFDHGKRDVSDFPIATGTYYKVDYSPGTDISFYKNIPVPTSYMAVKSKYDFVGGYEHDSKGGLLHVANHHVSTGKKQWTWGNGDFGKAWDRNLTDEDGPYIELMTGMYCDNQPDFSWLMPHEEKSFVQYFMPYSEVGMVKNATKDALVNLTVKDGMATIICYTTALYEHALVQLKHGEVTLFEARIIISPECTFSTSIDIHSIPEHELSVILKTEHGKILVTYQPELYKEKAIPDAAVAATSPQDTTSIEQLYLTGLHIEQYRHATYCADDYYREALKREPGDVRCNNAMGLLLLRRGKFEAAENYFRKAIDTITQRNPNPYDGEALYNLGRCLQFQGRLDESFDVLYKAVWNAAWQDNGYFALAQIACAKNNFEEALELVDRSLIRNWHHHKARHLKVALLRKLNRGKEAMAVAEASLQIDGFNIGCYYEKYLLNKDINPGEAERWLQEIKTIQRKNIHNYIEYSLDYFWCGLYSEAVSFLQIGVDETAQAEQVYPMAVYFLGWFNVKMGNCTEAKAYFDRAARANPAGCFPNQVDALLALQTAIEYNAGDAKAHYYLGNFLYARKEYTDAIASWERSVELDGEFPTAHRNLALAYYNKSLQPDKALHALEKAFQLDTTDARVLMELDQLYKKINRPFAKRLALLEQYLDLVMSRDDLYLERITLYNSLGGYEQARQLIADRKFHPWEGGEGKVTGQFLFCHIALAKDALKVKDYKQALSFLACTDNYPHNLGEGKLPGIMENEIHYYKGCGYKGLGENEKATAWFEKATKGLSEPAQVFFYNDQKPDTIYFQGLALLELGKKEEARQRFSKLIQYGEAHLNDDIKLDYFAVSLPDFQIFDDDLNKRNQIHCLYLIKLGHAGLGENEKAENYSKLLTSLHLPIAIL